MTDAYSLLVTLHVVLFAYWLGADFGVYICSHYVARPDLSLDERLRFLDALITIDILPRSAIVLLPVVGLQLAAMRGSVNIPIWGLLLIWLIGVGWLLLVWQIYRVRREPRADKLLAWEASLRVPLIALLVGTGVYSLLTGSPVQHHWVAAKLVLFAVLLIYGLVLRITIRRWREGFQRLRIEGPSAEIDMLFRESLRTGRYRAWGYWVLIACMAYLGISQPF